MRDQPERVGRLPLAHAVVTAQQVDQKRERRFAEQLEHLVRHEAVRDLASAEPGHDLLAVFTEARVVCVEGRRSIPRALESYGRAPALRILEAGRIRAVVAERQIQASMAP